MFFDKGVCFSKNPYLILPFSKDNLYEVVKKCTLATEEIINNKRQLSYIFYYAEQMNAKTIIIEGNYIDKSYLEDFSAYYVKCFNKYQREVNRIHFFKTEFTKEDFGNVLDNNLQDKITELQQNYIGFTTIKKLPYTFIGKTCLKSLDTEERRHFATLRTYDVNLFGLELSIKALAYQEQDSTVCACATSSLWSIFHSTGKMFQHQIPSPVEITKMATDQASIDTRIFPNRSLNLKMIAQGIKSVGLEPYKININPNSMYILKASVYSYLRAKIPMLMAFSLIDKKSQQSLPLGHAVAVIGYSKPTNIVIANDDICKLKAFCIDKIYVHDDQVGPYARMIIQNDPTYGEILSTSFGLNMQNGYEPYVSVPFALSVPLYKSIRIPFSKIFEQTNTFDSILKYITNQLGYNYNIEWDIYLQSRTQLRTDILNFEHDNINNIEKVLTRSLPSYVWCSDIIIDNKKMLKILFDATDIESGLSFIDIIVYNEAENSGFYNYFVFLCKYIYNNIPDTRQNPYLYGFSTNSITENLEYNLINS